MTDAERVRGEGLGLLTRLRRDTAGNTLAIMAAALVPLLAFTGSAVDMARLYVVKVRLQQACDAGALAARHAMTDTNPTTSLDSTASAQGQQFFSNNFQSGWFQAANPVFTPRKAQVNQSTVANAVSGTATVTVPMVLMNYFGAPPVTLSVSCQAMFDVTDADIMFVLDNTGSMSCYPTDPSDCVNWPMTSFTRTDGTTGYYHPEKSPTTVNGNTEYAKIEGLRQAVMLFDSTMRANVGTSTHFRYGFVPYASATNVGAAIKNMSSSYLQTSWTYQSRQVNRDYNYGSATSFTLTGIAKTTCYNQRYPASGYATSGPTWNTSYYQAMSYYNVNWTASNNGTCTGTQQPLRPVWRYQQYTLNTSQYILGNAVTNPSRLDGSMTKWRGCVEELNTTASTSFDVNNLPDDLDPDVIPTDPNNKWRPIWNDAEWLRSSPTTVDVNDDQINEGNPQVDTDKTFHPGDPYDKNDQNACGMPAQELGEMTAQQVHDYVYANDFRAFGSTYHDAGMIWGNRLLSTKGIFAKDTTPWPGHNPPTRSIVFMTDGTMASSSTTYGQYGLEPVDRRITGNGDSTASQNNHIARFRVECDAAKASGTTIYVVALGTGLTDDLIYCASPGQAITASSTDQLTAAFANIAKRVAKLRISQ